MERQFDLTYWSEKFLETVYSRKDEFRGNRKAAANTTGIKKAGILLSIN